MGGFSKVPLPPASSGGNGDADLPSGADFSAPAQAASIKPATTTASSRRSSFLNNLTGNDFGLSAPVGPVGSGAANRPDDVFKVETVLDGAGLLARKPGRAFGNDTQKAITTAQQSFNTTHAKRLGVTSLKEDGLVNPGGPTQSATRDLATSLIGDDKEVASILKMRQAEETKTKAAAQRSKMVKTAMENARRNPRSLLDRTPRPSAKAAAPRPARPSRPVQPVRSSIPNAGQPWWRQGGLKPMTAAGDASNQRTADHLRTIHGVGDMPRWTADALETAGDKGVRDVADLLEKVHQNNPAQARQLADETFERLSEPMQNRLRAMEAAPVTVETETKFSAKHTAAKKVKTSDPSGDGGLAAEATRPAGEDNKAAPTDFFTDKNQQRLTAAARGGDAKVVEQIQERLLKDPKALNKLSPELRTFYETYQEHLLTQVPTTDSGTLAKRRHNAMKAARNGMATHHTPNAAVQAAAKTASDAVKGAGQLTGSGTITDAGRRLEKNIEQTFPVPDDLRNTRTAQGDEMLGKIGAGAATGILGRAGKMAAGASTLINSMDAAGKAAGEVAKRGGSDSEQRLAAFNAAAAEALGPKVTEIAGKKAAELTKKYLGADDLSLSNKRWLETVNGALAPMGWRLMGNGAIQRILDKKSRK
jgi:hypothetical protein